MFKIGDKVICVEATVIYDWFSETKIIKNDVI